MGPAKQTRENTRKGMRAVGWGPRHIARPDIGRGRDALRRGMSKKRATPIFDLSLRVVPAPHVCGAIPALYAYSAFFVCSSTFYRHATPDARERIPAPHAGTRARATSHWH